jgi:hypothetical protein
MQASWNIFEQKPDQHLIGQKCIKCSTLKTSESNIKKAGKNILDRYRKVKENKK